ncbi:MAG TPA: M50 family metallopeptidase [Pyrinomonadaceae bacterium]|nr:M50 family metallopeptidase [Pyrinomonadaceae bacterium]
MRYQLATDARPQARKLLFAALLTIALWFIPYAGIVTYPFRLFVTFIHEGGHAIASLLTGNAVRSLTVAPNASGLTETYMTNPGLFTQTVISSAGYVGAMLFGALLLVLVRRTVAARLVLAGSAVFIGLLTLVYGFIVPLTHMSFSPFTVGTGVLLVAGLLAAARYLSPRAANFLVGFLAVQCVLNALFDLKDVLFLSVATDAQTDALNMAHATGVPAFFWSLIWIGLAFIILSAALRAYAVSRNKPSQPDLPFEDAPTV